MVLNLIKIYYDRNKIKYIQLFFLPSPFLMPYIYIFSIYSFIFDYSFILPICICCTYNYRDGEMGMANSHHHPASHRNPSVAEYNRPGEATATAGTLEWKKARKKFEAFFSCSITSFISVAIRIGYS